MIYDLPAEMTYPPTAKRCRPLAPEHGARPVSNKTGIAPIFPETRSLVDRVSHSVRRAIREGHLRPGEGLSISDLAADLGVSHSPVREALQRLAGEGLVVLRPARTAIVAPLDLEDLHEIYRLRSQVEVDAAARAAPGFTDHDLFLIEEEFDRLVAVRYDSEEFWIHHTAFHLGLMEPASTPRLRRIVTELWEAGERYIRLVYLETDVLFAHSPRERHLPLLEAARARTSLAMRKALTSHLRSNEREIVKSLKQTVLAASDGDDRSAAR